MIIIIYALPMIQYVFNGSLLLTFSLVCDFDYPSIDLIYFYIIC